MATTELRDAQAIEMPPPPRRGRPPKPKIEDDEENQAETLESSDFTPFDGKEDPFPWLSQFDASAWANSNMIAYLYRTAPTIDRRANGKPTSLRKYAEFFDQDRVMHEFGSGTYRVDVVRLDPKRPNKYVRIAQFYFSIMNLDYPPKVPDGDWVDEPENKCWEWARGAIKQNSAELASGSHAAADPRQIMTSTMEMFKGMREMMPEAPKGDPVMAAVLTGMMGMMTELMKSREQPRATEPEGQFTKFLTAMLTASQNEAAELRKLILQQAAPKSIKDQLLDAREIQDLMNKGNGKPSKASFEDRAMDLAETVVPQVLPAIIHKFGQQQPQQQQFRPQPQPQPAPAPAAETQTLQETPMPADPNAMTPERQNVIVSKWGAIMQEVGYTMVDKFRHESGDDFRDWFVARKGEQMYLELRGDVKPLELAQLCAAHTTLNTMMKPFEKVLEFFQDFMDPDGADEDDDQGDGSQVPIGGKP